MKLKQEKQLVTQLLPNSNIIHIECHTKLLNKHHQDMCCMVLALLQNANRNAMVYSPLGPDVADNSTTALARFVSELALFFEICD